MSENTSPGYEEFRDRWERALRAAQPYRDEIARILAKSGTIIKVANGYLVTELPPGSQLLIDQLDGLALQAAKKALGDKENTLP
jgi:hypothetical protein